jgi:hypothetical protein
MPVKSTGELFAAYLLGQTPKPRWDPVSEFGLTTPGGPVIIGRRQSRPVKRPEPSSGALANYVREAIPSDGIDRLVRGFAYLKGIHIPAYV